MKFSSSPAALPRSYRYFRPGDRFLMIFLAFLSAFPPITTDMYLPALPAMGTALNADNELVSFTISAFLLIFALSMLFWGPLSDRYGRRPILLGGTGLFIISSSAIALADSFWAVLLWRCVEAVGSGAACAMSLAMVKDIFHGRLMEKVVSLIQASTVLAPMLAPVLGGLLLYITNWRGIFWALTGCGVLALCCTLLLRETTAARNPLPLSATFSRILVVLKERKFLYPLLIFSGLAMPFMSYLAVSAFIFQDIYHLSAQTFSMFFALNAGASLLGPILHLRLFRHWSRNKVIAGHISVITVFGVLLIFFGHHGPWYFTLLFMPITICGSALRPPSTVLLMRCVAGDTGTVSSLINCGGLLFGSCSMFLATLQLWPGPIIAVGSISALVGCACLLSWRLLLRRYGYAG